MDVLCKQGKEKKANPQKKQRVLQTHCFFRHPQTKPTHQPIVAYSQYEIVKLIYYF